MATVDPGTERLRAWAGANLDGADAASLEVKPLDGTGTSNHLLSLSSGTRSWVLRMAPAAKHARSAHDVIREYRVLRALADSGVPHPRALAACEDPEVFGAPFYVMQQLDGYSPQRPLDDGFPADERLRHQMGLTMVDALAEISTVDWRSGDLAGIGRPEGFLERQVSRWSGQLDTYRTRELPGLDEVASWLVEERPEQRDSSLIHGDYSFFNVLFARNSDRLLAVIDWETATIGDPLLDLGGLLSNWANPGEEPLFWRSATGLAGMPTRAELADLYARRTGRDLTHLPFYMTLASFRLACILEGAYAKYRAGESEHELHAEFEGDVPRLIEHAADVIEGRFGVDG